MKQLETYIRAGQGRAHYRLADVSKLRARALHELSPRWRVVEEISDVDRRADVSRRRLDFADRSAAVEDLVGSV